MLKELETPSVKRISPSRVSALLEKRTACHSMWNCRLGAVPVTEVKMPQPLAQVEHPLKPTSVRRSPWNGKMVTPVKRVSGKGQDVPKGATLPPNSNAPLELTVAALKVCP